MCFNISIWYFQCEGHPEEKANGASLRSRDGESPSETPALGEKGVPADD